MHVTKEEKAQITKISTNELHLIRNLEVAKKFAVPIPDEERTGKRKNTSLYWKGKVISTGKDPKFPVEIEFEPNPDGTVDFEEWDIDAFRKGRETFREEYPEEWEANLAKACSEKSAAEPHR